MSSQSWGLEQACFDSNTQADIGSWLYEYIIGTGSMLSTPRLPTLSSSSDNTVSVVERTITE